MCRGGSRPGARATRCHVSEAWWCQPVASAPPMTLPIFTPGADPGPSFHELLRRQGALPEPSQLDARDRIEITHGTTVVAVRYVDGVVMGVTPGPPRATSSRTARWRRSTR